MFANDGISVEKFLSAELPPGALVACFSRPWTAVPFEVIASTFPARTCLQEERAVWDVHPVHLHRPVGCPDVDEEADRDADAVEREPLAAARAWQATLPCWSQSQVEGLRDEDTIHVIHDTPAGPSGDRVLLVVGIENVDAGATSGRSVPLPAPKRTSCLISSLLEQLVARIEHDLPVELGAAPATSRRT